MKIFNGAINIKTDNLLKTLEMEHFRWEIENYHRKYHPKIPDFGEHL